MIDPTPIDPHQVEWSRVARATYLIRQAYRYEYPGPIAGLDHRLVIIPPERYGDQRRILHHLKATPEVEHEVRPDGFGNTVLELRFQRVERSVEFQAWIEVERQAAGPHLVPAWWLEDPRLLEPSELTVPDERLTAVATALSESGQSGLQLARLVNGWLFSNMRYRHGVTGVGTTAAEALALGQGVCQDFAHVMIAICRLLGLPARYVSGHLLGEGGTHAWVEVMQPLSGQASKAAAAWTFDPTHGRPATLSYVTVAVGRDYYDVAPTSGTYAYGPAGRLSSHKRVDLTRLDYQSA
ncbi:MAG: transglutaminase family protein [Candidatus Nephthysia bennettiae]|uniref:Transglutaminase family protein n=1 Tax=Candidatus Nephthysia bennettiae TaxID=3127016 RepID=A0A934NG03_9BACT|nr:transglutaminase family protein [Candidatus Dormibacteraeota bacterium]MBJ7611747.1 transglutaminase family protein [Candidatus Dormibacteraeota bacterium]PZR99411.1 MAG: transglutaminase family protein [Candidatus Dormibacteraeota bacterium]